MAMAFACVMSQDAETMGQEISDWERYAAEEYDHLVAEETANEQYNDGYGQVSIYTFTIFDCMSIITLHAVYLGGKCS